MSALDCDGREVNEGDRVWAGDLSGAATVTRVYETRPGEWRIDTDMEGRTDELPADWSLAEIAPPPYGIVDPCPGCGGEALVMDMVEHTWSSAGTCVAFVKCPCGWQGPKVPCKGGKAAMRAAKRKAVRLWNRRA